MITISLTVPKKQFLSAIQDIKYIQGKYISLTEKASFTQLNKAYLEIYKLIGAVDVLRKLELLDDGPYQGLVEQNIRLEEKIRLLLKEKKSTQPIASRVERVGNNSRS